jgi:hypothetical protein
MMTFSEAPEQTATGGRDGLPPKQVVRDYPLSLNQQQVWFECQLDPDSTLYNLGIRVTIEGPLDEQSFVAAFSGVVNRHEILKTAFAVIDDVPLQRVMSDVSAVLPVVRLEEAQAADWEDKSWKHLVSLGTKSFDLARGPLFRAELLRGTPMLHYFVIAFHHLILDEFYCGQLLKELISAYLCIVGGNELPQPPNYQYGDFSQAIRHRWDSGALAEAGQFWQRELRDPLPETLFPVDADIPPPWRVCSQVVCRFHPELVNKLRTISRRHRTTLFRSVLAGIGAYFARFSPNQEVIFDIDFSVRPREMSHTLGFFANLLPIRFRPSAFASFDSLVSGVDQKLRTASKNREFPVRQLIRTLKSRRNSQRPLGSVMVTQVGALDWSIGNLTIRGDAYVTATVHPLWIGVLERGDVIDLHIAYSDELFLRSRVESWASELKQLLTQLAARPGDPPAVSQRQQHNDPVTTRSDGSAVQLLSELEETL